MLLALFSDFLPCFYMYDMHFLCLFVQFLAKLVYPEIFTAQFYFENFRLKFARVCKSMKNKRVIYEVNA